MTYEVIKKARKELNRSEQLRVLKIKELTQKATKTKAAEKQEGVELGRAMKKRKNGIEEVKPT